MSIEPRNFTRGPAPSRYVLGALLEPCPTTPKTGFLRNGYFDTGLDDVDSHTVCVIGTDEFLEFPDQRGGTFDPTNGYSACLIRDREISDPEAVRLAPSLFRRSLAQPRYGAFRMTAAHC